MIERLEPASHNLPARKLWPFVTVEYGHITNVTAATKAAGSALLAHPFR